MLAAVEGARISISLEVYIYGDSGVGLQFRSALTEAARRGVRVRVLVDGIGSYELPDNFWSPLIEAGGEARIFNPIALGRIGIRNHRKLLVCDGTVAFIGGFNIAREYEGDGVTCGWCDLGLRLEGPIAAPLEESFRQMFALADFRHKRLPRWRRKLKRAPSDEPEQLLLCSPGRGSSPLLQALRNDLRSTDSVRLIVPYFLPSFRLRRRLQRLARDGKRVQLILPSKSDVALSLLAGRSLYQRLLRAGVEIYEYVPQILHAKMYLLNGAVYVGSANLDPRSLHLNYELMIRFTDPAMVAKANEIFDQTLQRCRRVDELSWRKSRSFWARWKERWANFLLARVDPYVALRQWRALRERLKPRRRKPELSAAQPSTTGRG